MPDDTRTIITIAIPDGQEAVKDATILLRRGENARIRTIRFSTLADLVDAAHDLSLEVQEIEFAAPVPTGTKKATPRKKSETPIAPKGTPKTQPVAADFAEKQLSLF